MTREEILKQVLDINTKSLCLSLSTGVGKTKIALEYMDKFNPKTILIVIPRLVLIENTKEEIKKWHKEHLLDKITFVTYVSLPKYGGKHFDFILCDEAHHLSERAIDAFSTLKYNHCAFLSATISRKVKFYLDTIGTKYISVGLKEAIDEKILPTPMVYLYPMLLESKNYTCILNKKAKNSNMQPLSIIYTERWKYKNYAGELNITCTPQQYYNEISNLIEWYKKKSSRSQVMKRIWLNESGKRLKWLSDQKIPKLLELRKHFNKYKTLIFCNTIQQTELLGNSINSKVGIDNLEKFNNNKIKFISACNILNEGVNIPSCRVTIFGNINNSEIITKQRSGRSLRNERPIIIIPFYRFTREEELVKKMLENYDESYITTISNINDIKL